MGDQIVELSPTGVDIQDIGLPQLDVGKPELLDDALPFFDLPLREIDAEELRFRQIDGLGNQIAAPAAPQFQHPAVVDVRRLHAEERRHRFEAPRVREGVGDIAVRHAVVGIGDRLFIDHGSVSRA